MPGNSRGEPDHRAADDERQGADAAHRRRRGAAQGEDRDHRQMDRRGGQARPGHRSEGGPAARAARALEAAAARGPATRARHWSTRWRSRRTASGSSCRRQPRVDRLGRGLQASCSAASSPAPSVPMRWCFCPTASSRSPAAGPVRKAMSASTTSTPARRSISAACPRSTASNDQAVLVKELVADRRRDLRPGAEPRRQEAGGRRLRSARARLGPRVRQAGARHREPRRLGARRRLHARRQGPGDREPRQDRQGLGPGRQGIAA